MPLMTSKGTFLNSRESADMLGIAYGTFCNNRAAKGDRFLRGHAELVRGRVLFRLEDVQRLAVERAV